METREREQERICFLSQVLVAALVVVSRHLFRDSGVFYEAVDARQLVAALVVVSRHLFLDGGDVHIRDIVLSQH